MTNEEIAALRKEIETLRAEVADIRGALKDEAESTTENFRSVYRFIADIHDYLMPVVRKVFPGYCAAKKQIDDFMERYGGSETPKETP